MRALSRSFSLGTILSGIVGLGSACAIDVPGGPFDTFGGDTGSGTGGETGEPECEGSALCFDPAPDGSCNDELECDAPPGPTDGCIPDPGAAIVVTAPTITEILPATQEAEISAVVAPDGTEYVATQVIDWESRGLGADPAFCLVQKGIAIYRRGPGEANFDPVEVVPAGGENLSIDPSATSDLRWYTDPYLAVSEETGAVFLVVLKWPGLTSSACDNTVDQRTPTTDFDEEVQLWVVAPGESALTKVAVDNNGVSQISAGLNGPTPKRLDHPRVAVHHVTDEAIDRVVVTFNIFNPNDQDRFVTLDCAWPGGCAPAGAGFDPGNQTGLPSTDLISFSNPRFDGVGNLYIAHAHREAGEADRPEVLRFTWNGDDEVWDPIAALDGGVGGPTPTNTYFTAFEVSESVSAPDRDITIDVTPAIAIGQLGNTTTPVVWLAWVTRDDDGDPDTADDYGVEVAAANADDVSVGSWTPTVPVPKLVNPMTMRANHWAPELAVDGDLNILDLVNYNSDPSMGSFHLALTSAIWPRVTRFRANDLVFVAQADAVPNPGTNAPRVMDLPSRGPGTTGLFLGEYIGLAQRPDSGRSLVAWNLQRDEEGLRRSDAAAATFDAGCSMGLNLANGTSMVDSPLVTCSEPSTTLVELDTFGTSLAALCEHFPLCGTAELLELEITATLVEQTGQRPPTEGARVVGTAELEVQDGEVVLASEVVDEALGAGSHVVELCATDVSTSEPQLLGCLEQPLIVAVPLGSGDDGFGYFAGEVALDFVQLSTRTGATALSLSDDGIATVHLPPSLGFTFYGDAVEQVNVGANGGLAFIGSTISSINQALPTSAAGAPDIAVYWDDLNPSAAGQVLTFFDGRRFIISWEGVRHVASGDVMSMQAHLHPDGRMEMHYLDTDAGSTSLGDGATATIGIQDGGGDFVLVSHDDSTLLGSGIRGLAFTTDECIASPLIIPSGVSCTAPDIGVTVCASHGLPVTIPTPNVEDCASDAVEIIGRVTHSGRTRDGQHERAETLPIVGGRVMIDLGVHTVEWTPLNVSGFAVGEPFVQLVHVGQWATQLNCCASGQTVVNLTQANDTFTGGTTAECVLAEDGDDVITTFGSADTVAGGRGSETLLTGADGDVLVCEPGDDEALGGGAADLLDGGPGQDTLDGDGGDDVLDGGADSDVLTGGAGADVLRGRAGDDVLVGGAGPDKLYPGSGVDAVFGDGGNDEIYLLDGCELTSGKALSGGSGSDTLFVPPWVTLGDLTAAGVFVSSDIEQVVQLSWSHAFESDCG